MITNHQIYGNQDIALYRYAHAHQYTYTYVGTRTRTRTHIAHAEKHVRSGSESMHGIRSGHRLD